jgi:hypothetical protein
MIKKLNGLFFLVLLLSLYACVSAPSSPLQQLQGAWLFSFDESVAENPQIQEAVNNDPDLGVYLRRSMENIVMVFDTEKNTITLPEREDGEDVTLDFTVLSETPEDGTLVLSLTTTEEEVVLTVSPQRLIWVNKGDLETMVFTRKP